jgi:hypothetical protein
MQKHKEHTNNSENNFQIATDFISTANKAFFETTPTYSHMDIDNAIVYAIDGIAVDPSEVGKVVYGYLFREKMYEYLGNPQ